jgi:pentose-5-phosphate-3-epimerase
VQVPIDVHLMVKPVDRIVPDFAKAGANIISFNFVWNGLTQSIKTRNPHGNV